MKIIGFIGPNFLNWTFGKFRLRFSQTDFLNFIAPFNYSYGQIFPAKFKKTRFYDGRRTFCDPPKIREIKLLPEEPVYRRMPAGPGQLWKKSFFQNVKDFVKMWKFSASYDKNFNFRDFSDGSKLALLTVSKTLLNRSFDDLKNLVHSSLYDKIKNGMEKLNDTEVEQLLTFREKDILMSWMMDCNYRYDSDNPAIIYFEISTGFQCLVGFEKISKSIDEKISKEKDFSFSKMKSYMQEVEKQYQSYSLTANLAFSKQIEPNVDNEWQLVYFNCARSVEN